MNARRGALDVRGLEARENCRTSFTKLPDVILDGILNSPLYEGGRSGAHES